MVRKENQKNQSIMDETQLLLGNQLCFPVYSASKLITKAYKPHLDRLGVTYPQYLVLLVLWEQDLQTIHEIKQKLLLDTNTLSPMLKRMEKMELLHRKRSKTDERSVIIMLTAQGKNLRKQALQIPEQLMTSMACEDMNQAGLIQLRDTLSVLIQQLQKIVNK